MQYKVETSVGVWTNCKLIQPRPRPFGVDASRVGLRILVSTFVEGTGRAKSMQSSWLGKEKVNKFS
jgi:hypothetical protein